MNSDILVKLPDNLGGMTKEEVQQSLIEKLSGRVQAAYLYGSFLTDRFNRSSDIDLIIIKNTTTTFIERGLEFSDLRDWLPSIEPLVYTPQEFQRLTHDPTVGFWEEVVRTMKQIV